VRTRYNVTEKADDIRALGYVNPKGMLFLLYHSMNMYHTVFKIRHVLIAWWMENG
jgi:hypothetical protein